MTNDKKWRKIEGRKIRGERSRKKYIYKKRKLEYLGCKLYYRVKYTVEGKEKKCFGYTSSKIIQLIWTEVNIVTIVTKDRHCKKTM